MNAPAIPMNVRHHLLAAPGEFDFVQAVDLLQQWAEKSRPPGGPRPQALGKGSDPRKEALALTAAFELSFRPQPLEGIDARAGRARPLLTTNFFGLAGPDGPLPEAYVELIRTQVLAQESGAAEFLAIFQHRLLSFAYRAENEFRSVGPFSAPGEGPLAAALRGLLGMQKGDTDPHLEQLLQSNMALASQQRRSLHGFVTLLGKQFGVKVTGSEWAGRWAALPDELQTVLGEAGRNDVLGEGAVLGSRVLNVDGAVRVDLGSVPEALYLSLLPQGARHRELASLCSWYLGPNLCCYVRMAMEAAELPPPVLDDTYLLGHTTWLGPARGLPAIELVLNELPPDQQGVRQ